MSPFSNFASTASEGPVNPSAPDASKVVFFSPYERKGVVIMAVAGVTSCVLVSSLLLYILFTAISPWPRRSPDAPPPFTRKQIAVFVICLLSSDLIQSISGITQVKWAMENRIYEGRACSIQAATLVMGDLGSTVWSCVIAAHTFSGLALGKQWPRWVVCVTVVTGWVFVITLTAIGPTTLAIASKGPFFSIAGTWCFISSEYAIPRLGIHYIPLFVAAAIILIFYVLVFLVLRGRIAFTRHRLQGLHVSPVRMADVFSRERVIVAKRMLWYPVAYLTCILPIAIIRLVGLKQENVPEAVWIFGMFFLFSLGAIDTVIYTKTRTLIKPMSFPTHLRTFSDNSSTKTAVTSPKKSMTSESSDYFGKDLDKMSYSCASPIEGDIGEPSAPDKTGPGSGSGSYHEARTGAIHVTLERIQEVI